MAAVAAAVVSPPDPFSVILVDLPLAIRFVPGAAYLCYGPGWWSLRARVA